MNPYKIIMSGFLMGVADIVPGISGSTIALVLGIYERFIKSLSWLSSGLVSLILKKKFKDIFQAKELRFLFILGLGIITSLISMSYFIDYLLTHNPYLLWGIFFVFITYSTLLIFKDYFEWRKVIYWVLLVVGALISYQLTHRFQLRLEESPLNYLFAGMIAICTMLIPGISGSYILVIMGLYEGVIAAIKNPFDHTKLLLFFVLGAALSFLFFSRFLKWLIDHYKKPLICFMLGFVCGSLPSIWPSVKASPNLTGNIAIAIVSSICLFLSLYQMKSRKRV